MTASETWYKNLSLLALVCALGASSFAIYRIWRGEATMEDAGFSAMIPIVGSAILSAPVLKKMTIENRLKRLELERLEAV